MYDSKEKQNGLTMKTINDFKSINGDWIKIDNGISVDSDNLSVALSGTKAVDFVCEAQLDFSKKDGCAAIVFSASEDYKNEGCFAACVDIEQRRASILRFSGKRMKVEAEFPLTSAEISKCSFNLRLQFIGKDIVFFVDDKTILAHSVSEKTPGDRLGLMAYKTKASFSNFKFFEIDAEKQSVTRIEWIGGFDGKAFQTVNLPADTKELTVKCFSNRGSVSAEAFDLKGEMQVNANYNEFTVENINDDFKLVINNVFGEVKRSYVLEYVTEKQHEQLYNEEYRAQLHFSTQKNWINDPNGLVYDTSNNTYHLFYQYNPYGNIIANQVWGHAVSDDLLHWKELPIAIPQDSVGDVFSGGAVVDEDNTSGFFTDNKPGESKLVAFFTAHGKDLTHGLQKQCLAWSKDHGLTWTRPTIEKDGFENPIIPNDNDKYGMDFRDPKVFKFDGKWIMVVAGGHARIFSSDDLIHWKHESDVGIQSECPDIYPLCVDGDSNNVKWVYNGSGKWYCLGNLINDNGTYRFVRDTGMLINYAGDLYASQTYYNTSSGFETKVSVSWITDFSGRFVGDKMWSGLESIPYEHKLVTANGKTVMTAYPIAEFDSLRNTKQIDLSDTTCEKINEKLSENPLRAFDMLVTFKPEENSVVKFRLRSNGELSTDVIYNSEKNTLTLDRSHYRENLDYLPVDSAELPLYKKDDGTISLRIILDTCVVDAFGNEGQAVLCGLTFPESDCLVSKIEVEGTVKIKSFELYSMNSIWHKDKEIT